MMSAADSEPPGCPEPAAVMERSVSLRISVARCFSSWIVSSVSMVGCTFLLQLGQGRADPPERQGDVLARRGVGEAQVAFAERAEAGSGQAGDARVVEQVVSDLLGWAVEALDVGKDIEGSVWSAAGDAGDGVEPLDNDLAAGQELLSHGLHIILRAGQGLDPGNLGERGGAGRRVGDDLGHPFDELTRAGCIAKAPPGHGVGLGHAVRDDRAFLHPGERRDGKVLTLEHQARVDLVRQDIEVVLLGHLRDQLQVLARDDAAGGVGWRVDDDKLCARRDQLDKGVTVEAEVLLLKDGEGDRLGTGDVDDRLVDGIRGIRVDSFIAVLEQGHARRVDDVLGPGADQHFFSRDWETTGPADVLRDRLAKVHTTHGGRVVGVVLLDGPDASLLDVLRGIEVGFADLHIDHALALTFQFLCLGHDEECSLAAGPLHTLRYIQHVLYLPPDDSALTRDRAPGYLSCLCPALGCMNGRLTTMPVSAFPRIGIYTVSPTFTASFSTMHRA